MDLKHFTDAVFVSLCADKWGESSRGTAFAVGDGSFAVTAAHVIQGHDTCLLFRGARLGDHWGSKGRVAYLDEVSDVAILKLEKPSPHALQIGPGRLPTEVDHLLVWDWPTWQVGSKPFQERDAQPRGLAALYTSTWTTKNQSPRFGFAARIEHGMSGGPIVGAQSGDVFGLVIEHWRVNEEEVVESWWDSLEDGYEIGTRTDVEPSHLRNSMKAHLALGIGIAVPAACIASALERIP